MNKKAIMPLTVAILLLNLSACSTDINLTGSETIATESTILEIQSTENATESSTQNLNIPKDAKNFNGHAYYVFDADKEKIDNYDDAVKFCEDSDGYLAEISSQKENDFVYDLVIDSGYTSAYFGYLRNPDNSLWSYPHGSSDKYTNWADDQPDSGLLNNYAKFGTAIANGEWVNDSFGESEDSIDEDGLKAFICEWDTANPDSEKVWAFEDSSEESSNFSEDEQKEGFEDLPTE